MSDFNGTGQRTDFKRDMRLAAEYGAKAVFAELNGRELGTYASDRIRMTFRTGVLDKYTFAAWDDGLHSESVTTGYLRDLRAQLNAAYYGQADMIAEINRKPVAFDPPTEIVVNGEELDMTGMASEFFVSQAQRVMTEVAAETIASLSA